MTKKSRCCEENYDEMSEFEKQMALKWGTPKGISEILLGLGGFLICIGIFLWLLHLAGII